MSRNSVDLADDSYTAQAILLPDDIIG